MLSGRAIGQKNQNRMCADGWIKTVRPTVLQQDYVAFLLKIRVRCSRADADDMQSRRVGCGHTIPLPRTTRTSSHSACSLSTT
jgi:hypothetical protein